MAWQNLFDAGPCNVYLACADSTHLLLGAMSKGSSQTHHDSTAGRDYTVSVDASGVVSVSSSAGGFVGSEVIGISLVPSSSIVGQGIRLRNVSYDATANVSFGYTDWAAGGTYQSFTIGPPVSPDPMVLAAATSGTMTNGMGMRASNA